MMSNQKRNRRDFLKQSAVLGALFASPHPAFTAGAMPSTSEGEWRNRQAEMVYRKLGRTNFMISEVVSGGDPVRSDNFGHLRLALDRGLNYLDMAPAYGRGDCETAYGKLLGGSSSLRERVFLTTKISGLTAVRNELYREIFEGLPGDRQRPIQRRAEELLEKSGIARPGYFMEYFPGQRRSLEAPLLSNAMAPDYAHKVDGNPRFRQFIVDSVEQSLRRVGTDYFDIVLCPHGATTPEELEIPEIAETFADLKKQGKVRFLGVSSHNGPAAILRKATQLPHYDVAMVAYNIVNGGYLEEAIREAAARGMGVIAMKAAMAVATHHESLQPVPRWRVEMVDRIVPGDLKPPLKAYTWVLQNPGISAVISNLWDETFIRENLSVAGKRVELQPA